MTFWPAIVASLLGLGSVLLLIPLILRGSALGFFGQRVRDLHHTHEVVVPRFGGLALALAFTAVQIFITLLIPETHELTRDRCVIWLTSLAMFGLGFWDDIKPLGARKKLLGQILLA